jgi:hypothetical protein
MSNFGMKFFLIIKFNKYFNLEFKLEQIKIIVSSNPIDLI